MTRYRMVLTGALIMMATGCSAGEPVDANLGEHARLVAQGNNLFAWQLYQRLRDNEGNLFFSPYSISTALALAYAGAQGETERQMAQALCLPTARDALEKLGVTADPMAPDELARAFGGIVKDLNARGGEDKYVLRVANALWGQKDYALLPAFVKRVEAEYGGKLEPVDFVAAAEKARQTINAWVEKQTNDKIKDLISPGVLDAMTRLVLTNAVYFKGNWASQFKKERTWEAPFTLSDGVKIQTPMMHQTEEFGYGQTDTLQVLEMPYVGKELSMVILLPKKADGIKQLEQELTADTLREWLGRVRTREVIVAIPKFKMTKKFGLERVLASMGMSRAFSREADFSGMTGHRDLFISAVVHQAYVDVNEEGTEAAAATGVVMKLTSMGPDTTPVFRADHPFVFVIRDTKSGSILFIGRLTDPQA